MVSGQVTAKKSSVINESDLRFLPRLADSGDEDEFAAEFDGRHRFRQNDNNMLGQESSSDDSLSDDQDDRPNDDDLNGDNQYSQSSHKNPTEKYNRNETRSTPSNLSKITSHEKSGEIDGNNLSVRNFSGGNDSNFNSCHNIIFHDWRILVAAKSERLSVDGTVWRQGDPQG